MAKLSTLIAALALVAFAAPAAFANCSGHQTAQTSVQTAEQPQQTPMPAGTTKTENAAQ